MDDKCLNKKRREESSRRKVISRAQNCVKVRRDKNLYAFFGERRFRAIKFEIRARRGFVGRAEDVRVVTSLFYLALRLEKGLSLDTGIERICNVVSSKGNRP